MAQQEWLARIKPNGRKTATGSGNCSEIEVRSIKCTKSTGGGEEGGREGDTREAAWAGSAACKENKNKKNRIVRPHNK